MSLRSWVPSLVPSVTHSSFPWVPSLALKSTMSPKTTNEEGLLELVPSRMSFRSSVPAGVPSVIQSSVPYTSDRAEKTSFEPNTTASNCSYPIGLAS